MAQAYNEYRKEETIIGVTLQPKALEIIKEAQVRARVLETIKEAPTRARAFHQVKAISLQARNLENNLETLV